MSYPYKFYPNLIQNLDPDAITSSGGQHISSVYLLIFFYHRVSISSDIWSLDVWPNWTTRYRNFGLKEKSSLTPLNIRSVPHSDTFLVFFVLAASLLSLICSKASLSHLIHLSHTMTHIIFITNMFFCCILSYCDWKNYQISVT